MESRLHYRRLVAHDDSPLLARARFEVARELHATFLLPPTHPAPAKFIPLSSRVPCCSASSHADLIVAHVIILLDMLARGGITVWRARGGSAVGSSV